MVSHLTGGHSGSVLCVDVSPLTSQVASGGENGELCLWSGAGELLHKYTCTQPDTDCTSVLFSRAKPNTLYAAFGMEVLMMDTADLQTPLFTFRSNQDEVSQVALDDKEQFLAACDDGGEIKVYGLQDRKVFKTLRFKHTNMCSSVVFRGKQRPWELLSGGLDCRLVHWNFSRPESLNQFNMQELHSTTSDMGYLVNPPFIHHLACNRAGTLTAAALENGLVAVFDSSAKHLQEKWCLQAHQQGASQLHFLTDNFLLSAGNDARIVLWDLSKAEPQQEAQGDVATNGNGCVADDVRDDEDHRNQSISEACRASVLQHSSKVNWLAPFLQDDKWSVVVADQTSDLTIHPLTLT